MSRFLQPKFWISRLFFFLRIRLPFCVLVTDDTRIWLDPLSVPHALWLDRIKKGRDIEVIRKLVQVGDVCVDVGANVGHLALVMARRAGNGKVVAVEPGKRMFESLERNIVLNKLTNIVPVHAVVSEQDGEADFYEYSHADTFSSMVNIKNAPSLRYKVRSVSLSELMREQNIDHIDFLKIDVEGAELHVLKSLGNFLPKVKKIYFEYSESNYGNFGYTGKDVVQFLKEGGFSIHEVFLDANGDISTRPVERFVDDNYLATTNIYV